MSSELLSRIVTVANFFAFMCTGDRQYDTVASLFLKQSAGNAYLIS